VEVPFSFYIVIALYFFTVKEGWSLIMGSVLYKYRRNQFHGDVKKGLV
jgi:hypothetical protein